MAAPDFHQDVIDQLSYRAAFICSKPDCRKLTVGPARAPNPLKLLIGEAAHISDARPGKKQPPPARFDPNMTDDQRAAFENGIWLCASCHTVIDKNNGADHSIAELQKWKADHEESIRALMMSQKSPFPFLRQFAIEGEVAQDIVNMFETHGALFEDMQYEVDHHVVDSLSYMRLRLDEFISKVKHDKPLQKQIK